MLQKLSLVLLVPFLLYAENKASLQKPGPVIYGGQYDKLYKSGESTTVQGNVLSMKEYDKDKVDGPGFEMKVATAAGDVRVQLGPRWVNSDYDTKFRNGEPITIVGVKVTLEKQPVIIADKILRNTNLSNRNPSALKTEGEKK